MRNSSGSRCCAVSSRRSRYASPAQFDAAGAGADHRHRSDAGMASHRAKQREPALVELADRLHRHAWASAPAHGRGRGVEPMLIDSAFVGHRRTGAADHPRAARSMPITSSGNSERRQIRQGAARSMCTSSQRVVPGNVARQHARSRGVGIGADQRQGAPGSGFIAHDCAARTTWLGPPPINTMSRNTGVSGACDSIPKQS